MTNSPGEPMLNAEEEPRAKEIAYRTAHPVNAPLPFGTKRAVWITLAYLIGAPSCSAALTIALQLVVLLRTPKVQSISTAAMVAVGSIGSLVAGALTVHMARRSFSTDSVDQFKTRLGLVPASLREVVIAAAAGVALCMFNLVVVTRFAHPPMAQKLNGFAAAAATPGWSRIAWTVYVVAVTPLVEEFVFRGVLFAGLLYSLSRASAACVTVLAFAVIHVVGLTSYLPAVFMVFLLSVLAQSARMLSMSLLPSIIVHLMYNITCAVTVHL